MSHILIQILTHEGEKASIGMSVCKSDLCIATYIDFCLVLSERKLQSSMCCVMKSVHESLRMCERETVHCQVHRLCPHPG